MKLLKELIGFLKNPKNELEKLPQTKSKIFFIFKVLLFNLIIGLIAGIPFMIIIRNFNIININMKIMEIWSEFFFIFDVILFYPIIEEIAFRLSLSYKRLNISFSIAAIGFLISRSILTYNIQIISLFLIGKLLSIAIIIGILTYIILLIPNIDNNLQSFFKNNIKLIVYVSIILFGFYHLNKYVVSIQLLVLSPYLILRETLFGIFLTYTRFKLEFNYAVILHIIFNSIAYVFLNY